MAERVRHHSWYTLRGGVGTAVDPTSPGVAIIVLDTPKLPGSNFRWHVCGLVAWIDGGATFDANVICDAVGGRRIFRFQEPTSGPAPAATDSGMKLSGLEYRGMENEDLRFTLTESGSLGIDLSVALEIEEILREPTMRVNPGAIDNRQPQFIENEPGYSGGAMPDNQSYERGDSS